MIPQSQTNPAELNRISTIRDAKRREEREKKKDEEELARLFIVWHNEFPENRPTLH